MGESDGKVVLVVDNNEVFLDAVEEMLSQAGYRVETAIDGVYALQMIAKDPPDFILLDIVMEKIGGERVCRYLKAHPRFKHIPLIIVSGVIAEQDSRVMEIGADAYVVKGRLEVMSHNILDTLERLDREDYSLSDRIIGLENIDSRVMVSELIKMRAHHETILQNLAEGVIETDDEANVVFVNRAVLELIDRQEWEAIGEKLNSLFERNESSRIGRAVRALLKGQRITHRSLDMQMGDRILTVAISRVVEESNVTGLLAIVMDVTEREEMAEGLRRYSVELEQKMEEIDRTQKELIKSEKLAAVTKLVAGVAHEIKNPLNSMTFTALNLQSVIEDGAGVGQIRKNTAEHLEILKSDIERIGGLVDDFMNFASPKDSEPERCGINNIILSAIRNLGPEAGALQIEISSKLDDAIGDILGEEGELLRMISNLLRNGIEAIGTKGKITVKSSIVKGKVNIRVKDTGVGIPPGLGDKVFDLFFTTKDSGHGMGLAQVLRTVSSLGGTVVFESKPNKGGKPNGTTFTIDLPYKFV
jgi:PAS domain S-box-containing protein